MSEEIPESSDNAAPAEVADRIEVLAHGWRASHDGALANMEAALPGWVGEAAEALKELIAKQKTDDDQMHARLMRSAQIIRESQQLPPSSWLD